MRIDCALLNHKRHIIIICMAVANEEYMHFASASKPVANSDSSPPGVPALYAVLLAIQAQWYVKRVPYSREDCNRLVLHVLTKNKDGTV